MTPRAFLRQRNGILRPLARFFDNGTGSFDPSHVCSTPEWDGFKIDGPSRVFSTPKRNTLTHCVFFRPRQRDPSTPRAFFRPRNGIVSKLTTPRTFFRKRKRDPLTPRTFFRSRNGIVSKLSTPRASFRKRKRDSSSPRALFRPRNGILRPLVRFFDTGTGWFQN